MEIIGSSRARLAELRTVPLAVLDRPAIFSIEGPGATDCLQGIFTNEVAKTPTGSLIYGAFLTPKGAIITDGWVLKTAVGYYVVVEAAGREPVAAIFKRTLPPRLARAVDRTDQIGALWLLGPVGVAPVPAPFATWPEPGRVVSSGEGAQTDWHLAAGVSTAEFGALLLGPADQLNAPGFGIGTRDDLRMARVLAGVPTLGIEIDDRTLPQEVDFDRLGGVSYSKGCYVGQETVARIHFRGHPNWRMMGIRAEAGFGASDQRSRDSKPAVYLKTVIRLEDGTGLGLARVRREVEVGAGLAEGGSLVTVVELPQSP